MTGVYFRTPAAEANRASPWCWFLTPASQSGCHINTSLSSQACNTEPGYNPFEKRQRIPVSVDGG